MRLTEPVETTGMFWLPGRPDTKLSGTLKISDSGRITVELAGILDNPLAIPPKPGVATRVLLDDWPPDQPRIVGVLHQGGPITLDRCFHQNASASLPSDLSTSIIHANMAFIGIAYADQQKPLFSGCSFSLEGLDTWLSISSIKTEFDESNSDRLIRCTMPDDIVLNVAPGFELRFSFALAFSAPPVPGTGVNVRQIVHVSVKYGEAHPIEYFASIGSKLCNFLTLALDQPVSLQSLTAYVDQSSPSPTQAHREAVKVYAQFAPWTEKAPDIRLHNALFLYPSIANHSESMLSKWFASYIMFEPAFNLYFAVRTQPSQFVDTKNPLAYAST